MLRLLFLCNLYIRIRITAKISISCKLSNYNARISPSLVWAAVAGAGERWYHKRAACMLGSTGCGFMGHGYDDILGLVRTMEVFAMADTMGFITRYPELCPEFTELYRETLSYIEERVANGTLAGAWGDDHTDAGMAILRRNGIM